MFDIGWQELLVIAVVALTTIASAQANPEVAFRAAKEARELRARLEAEEEHMVKGFPTPDVMLARIAALLTFDIDANGILNVSAKDKATGKEQKIVIKASSGLSDEEVQRMVRDAEAHAEEDHKAAQLVHARNQADNLVHQVRKTVADLGDKLDGAEKTRVEEAIKATEDAARGDDKDAIEAATAALSAASASLAEKMYGGGEQAEPATGAGRCSRRQGR